MAGAIRKVNIGGKLKSFGYYVTSVKIIEIIEWSGGEIWLCRTENGRRFEAFAETGIVIWNEDLRVEVEE